MDPDATYAIIYDVDQPTLVRIEAVDDLIGWLDRGGFLPKGWSSAAYSTTATSRLRQTLRYERASLVRLLHREVVETQRRERAARAVD